MDELLQELLTEIQNNANELIETEIEHCDEYFVEQNLWRLPVSILAKGITTINEEEEFTWILSSLQAVQETCRESANWLIYKALDEPLTVIDIALKQYGSEVFKNGTWTEYPELMQD